MSEESDRELLEEDFVTNEHVELAAYYKWQHRGSPHGDALADWVNAHKELIQAGR
ncbi:MAG TPA: DUF2934 domain-containing protein [bacterium]